MVWEFHESAQDLLRAVRTLTGSPCRGLVIVGDPGVGRSRFLDEIVARIPGSERALRLVGSRTAREIPFGTLGAIAPHDVDDPAAWLTRAMPPAPPPPPRRDPRIPPVATRRAPSRPASTPPLVVVDDAHLLDDHTAALLHWIVVGDLGKVVVSVRRGAPATDVITSLWKDGWCERIELTAMSREASDRLLERALGGPVETATLLRLWEQCRGYPLLMREYVRAAADSGRIETRGDLRAISGPLRPSDRLVTMARGAMDALPPDQRDVAELIAYGGEIPVATMERLLDPEAIAALERQRSLLCDGDDYRLAAPGFGAALRAATPNATIRRLARTLSREVTPDVDDERDLLRFAIWRLDAGESNENSMYVQAARAAATRFDHELAERLARAALPEGGVDAQLLLANALIHQRRYDEAAELLSKAIADADTDLQRGRAAGIRSRLLYFRLDRPVEGIEVLSSAAASTDDPDIRDQLNASRAFLQALWGDVRAAIRVCRDIVERPDASDDSRLVALSSLVYPLAVVGEFDAAIAVANRGTASAARHAREYPLAGPMLALVRMMSIAYHGRLPLATRLGEEGYQDAIRAGARGVAGSWAMQLGRVAQLRGDLVTARRFHIEARRLLEDGDALGLRPVACGLEAIAAAEMGDVATARRRYEETAGSATVRDTRTRILLDRVRVSVTAAEGELQTAAEDAGRAGARCVEEQHLVWAAFLSHAAVRLGYPELSIDTLETVGERVEGPLMAAMLAHARALIAEDAGSLMDAGDAFSAVGAKLRAAEAMAQAAEIEARVSAGSRAAIIRGRAVALAAECPGAATPALRGLAVFPLTRREREIALLAARDLTSPQIADRLVLSVRTVDNHLAAVYRKLGIEGRHELTAAMHLR